MATGTIINSNVGGETELLRNALQALGDPSPGNYGGKTELLRQLVSDLQTWAGNGGGLPSSILGPATATAETIPRSVGGQSVTIATVSGTIYMNALYIPINTVVNNITVVTGSTASSNDVTINWAALCSSARVVLGVSANATTQLTPAGFNNTLALTTPFTTTSSGLYYVAYTVGATTTQPTVVGVTQAGTELTKIVPILCGTSSTAGTSTPPTAGSTLGAITATASMIYAFLT